MGSWGPVYPTLAAVETEGLGTAARETESPRPVTGVSISPVCVCTYAHTLLMDFHPVQEEAVGAACVYRSAEFALTCVASRVCMRCARVVGCVPMGNVCSAWTGLDLGAGSWGCSASGLLDLAPTSKGMWV